jgi:hypothetical protein
MRGRSRSRSAAPPASVARAESLAAAVLEHYLFDILDSIDAADAAGATQRDVRIDALHFLTDKFAHRRPQPAGTVRGIEGHSRRGRDDDGRQR